MCKMDILKYYGFVVGVESSRTHGRRIRTQNPTDFAVVVDQSGGAGGTERDSAAAGSSSASTEDDPPSLARVHPVRSTRVTEV